MNRAKAWGWFFLIIFGIPLVISMVANGSDYADECTGPNRPYHCDHYTDEEFAHDMGDVR